MKVVEEALLDDFQLWLKENGTTNEGSLENRLDEFMEEKYATTLASENIFETIKAMNSPPPSSREESSVGAVLQNLVACEGRDGQDDKNSRKKRSNEGEGFFLRNCHVQGDPKKMFLSVFELKSFLDVGFDSSTCVLESEFRA